MCICVCGCAYNNSYVCVWLCVHACVHVRTEEVPFVILGRLYLGISYFRRNFHLDSTYSALKSKTGNLFKGSSGPSMVIMSSWCVMTSQVLCLLSG